MPFGCRAFALLVTVADAPTQVDAPVLLDGDAMIDAPDDCDPATIYFAGEVLAWDAISANPSGVAGVTVTRREAKLEFDRADPDKIPVEAGKLTYVVVNAVT